MAMSTCYRANTGSRSIPASRCCSPFS